MNRDVLITRVGHLHARSSPKTWHWAQANQDAIRANWAERVRDKPDMFNGRVLLMSDFELEDDTCRATYFETDFADFLGWRDLGYPDPSIANGFAMGALQGADGAYICGVMGSHTANAGRIYFPAGTPDRSDLLSDGTVDLATGVIRELKEETELPADSYRTADDWIVVRRWPAVAFMRPIRFPEPADVVAERISANVAAQSDPELAGVYVVRGLEDIDENRMPLFLQSFFRFAFS